MIKTSVPLADAVGKHISHFCSFDLAKKNGEKVANWQQGGGLDVYAGDGGGV